MIDGKTFRIGKKVYMFTKTLDGYDDYFVNKELNRLLSFGLVIRFKDGDNHLECHNELPRYPIGYEW